MNAVLEDIYRSGKCLDLAGKERTVTGAVPREDALILQEMVRFVKAFPCGDSPPVGTTVWTRSRTQSTAARRWQA